MGNEDENSDEMKDRDDDESRMRGEAAESAAAPAPADEGFGDVKFDSDDEEARKPRVSRDPGAPTEEQIEDHNVIHLPFRSWCPACVSGKAKDRMHCRIKNEVQEVPIIVFDYCFLGTNDARPLFRFK